MSSPLQNDNFSQQIESDSKITFHEQTPKIILFISIMFLLAPIGNFSLSFHFLNIPNWYDPATFLKLLRLIETWDWIWNILVFISGALLLFRRKLAWLAATVSLIIVIISNFKSFFGSGAGPLNFSHLSICMIGTLSALAIILHFRFPYLDRRDNWLKLNRRKKVEMNTQILFQGDSKLDVQLTNISRSGAFVKIGIGNSSSLKPGELITLKLGQDFDVICVIKFKSDAGLGLQFSEQNPPLIFGKIKSYFDNISSD